MRKHIYIFFLIICNICLAQIVEIKEIKEVSKEIHKYHLIIFDLDNTIMEPIQLLGSDQWFSYKVKKYEKEGFDKKEALNRTLLQWYEIQSITKVKFVEKDIKNLIEALQNKKVRIIGLTTRNIDFAFAALKQLDALGIDLGKTAPFKRDLYFENGVVFKKGILFAGGKSKGQVLKEFLKKIRFFPTSIVFIDDKFKHIKDVKDFCKSVKIKFLGYRYGFLDEKIKNLNIQICNIQQNNFLNILSDDEAKDKLNK